MRSRQFVCNDPEVIRELRENFVAVSASDVDYRQSTSRDALDVRLLDRAFGGPQSIQQGHYIISPSGRMLASFASMWHVTDARGVQQAMRQGLSAYQRLAKSDRLLPQPPDAKKDRAHQPQDDFKRPAGCLDLRVVSRCLAFDGMNVAEDTRHPDFYRIDRLWYTPQEFAAFVPGDVSVGKSFAVTGAALDRLVRLHMGNQVQPVPPWQAGDVKEAELTGEVVKAAGGKITVRYHGHVDMHGQNPQNRRSYRGEILGEATWDAGTKAFRSFELLAFGTHTLPDDDTHGNAGSRTAPLGVLITLNPEGAQDRLPPQHWRWGYPQGWPRE